MERLWCSIEAHLKSNDHVCRVSWLSQESVHSQSYQKKKKEEEEEEEDIVSD